MHQFSGPETGMQLASPGGPYHSHLLLSSPRTGETKVLAAGGELQQVDDSDFVTAAPTLAAANILGNTRVVQVSRCCVNCILTQRWQVRSGRQWEPGGLLGPFAKGMAATGCCPTSRCRSSCLLGLAPCDMH